MSKTTESRSSETTSDDVLCRIRIPFVRRATLRIGSDTEDVFIIDLGLSGAFIERASPIEDSQAAELTFFLPENDRPIVAMCRIAWWQPAKARAVAPHGLRALPAGAGLEFVGMDRRDQERLRDYLLTYCRQETASRRFVRNGSRPEGGES